MGPVRQKRAERQQKRAEMQQQRAERQAEKREQQRQRKEKQRELKEQRQQSGALEPQVAETLSEQTGTIAVRTSADGSTAYVLETATGVLVLEVGPPRYWGDNHPLPPLVGTSVTVMGVQETGLGHVRRLRASVTRSSGALAGPRGPVA